MNSGPHDVLRQGLEAVLKSFTPDPHSQVPVAVQKAVYLAGLLQARATALQTPAERRQQAELDRMMQRPEDKSTLMQITDQAFRARSPHRVANQLTHVLDVQGVPRFFSPLERAALKGFQSFGSYLPGVAVPLVKEYMQRETANVILPADQELLARHLQQRRDEGVRMNVNLLGEALLGEREAEHRLKRYLEALQRPEIEVISIKISTIFSQIWPLARRHSIDVLAERFELLYRAALKSRFRRADGTEVPKFVYLDMEEYRDMSITSAAFMKSLNRSGMENVAAGIALQSYIPDAHRTQLELNAWARQRVARGGKPIVIRLVKGANLEMERVEASLMNWPQAPYKTKADTDANFKRMLVEGFKPENLQAVRLGIASHNLFEVAFALVLAVENNALPYVQFEMLEGMANHQRRALFELCRSLLLYAPACHREDFIYAIGYLVRRLDENTGPDNFLRHAFKLEVGSPDWHRLESKFIESYQTMHTTSDAPRRTQDRHRPPVAPMEPDHPWRQFKNEADTDFALAQNAQWAEELVTRWKQQTAEHPVDLPLTIAGEVVTDQRPVVEALDPSRPGVVIGRYRQANDEDIERAVACAKADPDGWRGLDKSQRAAILRQVAQRIREARGDLMGIALADGGKTLLESDPEVSEAVDFVEFYSRTALEFQSLAGLEAQPRGVVVVVSPWNFPIAIPCGGVVAALAAGNTVILKPASDTALVAHALCECFWRGGVSRKALQLVPCSGGTGGRQLVSHDDVDVVILTGGTETAIQMLKHKPQLQLLAETGGKNATIVTTISDRDLAIKHVLHSAFSHAGQKCSATSLLILEDEVFHDAAFRSALCDAVESIPVGSAWDLKTKMGPLIRPAAGVLETALKELEPGEMWAVMPHFSEENPHIVRPGVKWGVQPGSFTHMTEFFGPVLGVMNAKNLEEAIRFVNQTGYGLTSGLESLDDREQKIWIASIRAGNLYVNRSTTGAIVLRQPFGGMGKSAFGPGIKAGGPNYVAQLMRFRDLDKPTETAGALDAHLSELVARLPELSAVDPTWTKQQIDHLVCAMHSYQEAVESEFGCQHDNFSLIGQDNFRRYLPVEDLRVRIHPSDTCFEILARIYAAHTAGCRVTVSKPPRTDSPMLDRLEEITTSWAGAIEFVEESDEDLAEVIRLRHTDRLRYAAPDRVPPAIREAVIEQSIHIADTPVLMHGRVELLWYVQEQSVCVDYHRYGNLGARTDQERTEPL
jgi:RHH-type transcriptional regulator, proline utilization regulon repressor / proline dehydrogenase / delta 1-pyrroline-5-carboxylate dehydrogenase